MQNDPIIAEAISRLAIARSEVARLEAFLDVYQELRGGGSLASRSATPRRTVASTGAVADSATAAHAYIKEVGHPVPTRDLISILTARGIAIGGKDEIATLSARLSRSPLLVNIRGAGWSIASANEEGAAGDLLNSIPTAPDLSPNSADEDGREVEQEKTDLSQY